MKSKDELHAELETFEFANWHVYAVVHAMIDSGVTTALECQRQDCAIGIREFTKKNARGSRTGLTVDHIVPRREGGSHRPENLRLFHGACNYGWRKGQEGSFLDDEACAQIARGVAAAHVAGKYDHIYTPERNAKISAGSTRRWEAARAAKEVGSCV